MGFVSDDVWLPDDCVIKLENKSTGSIHTITTKVTNFSDGGGEKSTETVNHFGGASVVIKQPQEDFTVDFDVSSVDTDFAEFISDTVIQAGSFKMVQSGGNQDDFKIKLEWDSPTTTSRYKIIYYNAVGVSYNRDNAADDRLTGTLSFTVAPTSSNAVGQKLEFETADDTNVGIGSAITGSYGSYEAVYDAVFGYTVGGLL